MPNNTARVFCLQDDNFNHAGTYTGTWTLNVAGGVINDNALYDDTPTVCEYSASGNQLGPNVSMDLAGISPNNCCESATVTVRANVAQRRMEGTITWICNRQPTPGATTWMRCP